MATLGLDSTWLLTVVAVSVAWYVARRPRLRRAGQVQADIGQSARGVGFSETLARILACGDDTLRGASQSDVVSFRDTTLHICACFHSRGACPRQEGNCCVDSSDGRPACSDSRSTSKGVVSMAALYVPYAKVSEFVVHTLEAKIAHIESCGEETYNERMIKVPRTGERAEKRSEVRGLTGTSAEISGTLAAPGLRHGEA